MANKTLILLVLTGFSSAAFANDEPEDAPSIESLSAELKAVTQDRDLLQHELILMKRATDEAAALANPYSDASRREKAVVWLAELSSVDGKDAELASMIHERSLGFVISASRSSDALLRKQVIRVAPTWGEAAIRMLQERAMRERVVWENQKLALDGLASIGGTSAAEALYALASDEQLNDEATERARQLLTEQFAAYLVSRGGLPNRNSDVVGQGAFVAASGFTGGILLSSVGVWGQSDMGVGVGALGGTAIGAGTGYLYARDRPITRGQGLRYASNVAWGFVGSQLTNEVVFGDENSNDNLEALVRTAGVSAGAWLGYRAMDRDPDWGNVLETNATGILGATTASSIYSLATSKRDWQHEEGADLLDNENRDELQQQHYDRRDREESAVVFLGSALGLGVGSMIQDSWDPDAPDLGTAVLGSYVVTDALGLLEETDAFDTDYYDGNWGAVGTNLGLIGGLTAAHYLEPDWNTVSLSAGYSIIGKLGGISIATLADKPESDRLISTPLSIAGTVGGAIASTSLKPDKNDLAAVGVGTAIVTANTASITTKLYEGDAIENSTRDGMTGLLATVTAGGLLAASNGYDMARERSLFLTTGAGWGVYYGSLTQVLIPGELPLEDAALITVGVMDLGIGAAGYLTSEAGGIDPRDTFVPQLIGVAGGTVGALGVMLADASPEAIAGGALLGSTAGLVGGAMMAPKFKRSKKGSRTALLGTDAPGDWTFLALPSVGADGSMGGNVQLSVTGL